MSWLIENALSILAVLGVLGFLGGVGTFIYKVGIWKGSVDHDRTNFKTFMDEMRENINELQDDIKDIFKNVSPNQPLTKRNSPIILSQHGENLSVSIDARTIAEMYKNEVLSRIPDHEKRNPFIIEDTCMKFVQHELMPKLKEQFADRAKQIEIHAYHEGRKVFELLEVVGVVLCDMVLEELKIK